MTHEITVRAVWPELMKAKQTVLSALAIHGVSVAEDDLRYTLESTGQYHMPICLAWRGRPSIINPSNTSYSRRKTDRLDARKLAHHSLTGLWRETWMAPIAVEELRILTTQRARLASERIRLTNRINAEMLRFGHTVGQVGPMAGKLVRPLIEDFCRDGRVGIYGDYFSASRIVRFAMSQTWGSRSELRMRCEAPDFILPSKFCKLFTAISRGGQDAGRQPYKPWRHGSMR